MTPNARRLIALFLLAAFAAWLFATFWPFGKSARPDAPSGGVQTVEPKFRHEGFLAVRDSSSGDTLAQFAIEFADSPEEIMYGMMYRKSMADSMGMLFLMPEERPQSFYMKNTYVSLDIIYINRAQRIVSIQARAEPLSERSLPSGKPAAYVLEIRGGLAEERGIRPGQEVEFVKR